MQDLRRKSNRLIFFLTVFMLLAATLSDASQRYVGETGGKLSRGFTNVLFSFLEIGWRNDLYVSFSKPDVTLRSHQ